MKPHEIGIAALAIFSIGAMVFFYVASISGYSDAIVHGIVIDRWQTSEPVSGIAHGTFWRLNISLDNGTFGHESNTFIEIRVNCDFFDVGDEVYVRVPVKDNQLIDYSYNQVNPGYNLPEIYKPSGIGFSKVEGC